MTDAAFSALAVAEVPMPHAYDIHCDRCDFAQPDFMLSGALEAYVLGDGSCVRIPFEVAWCPSCRRVVRAELSARELIALIETRKALVKDTEESFRSAYLANCTLLRQVAEQRQSPARCLSCGSLDIIPGGSRGASMPPHPGCGGRFEFRLSGHRTFMDPTPLWAFSPEGESLGYQVVIP